MRQIKWILSVPAILGFIVINLPREVVGYNSTSIPHPAEVSSGVVIEEVSANSASEKAGLREGDVLLRWIRGRVEGAIISPFDVSLIEIEQGPRGPVTLIGRRGTEDFSLAMGAGNWGLKSRPNFEPPILSRLEAANRLVAEGKATEAVEVWRALAAEYEKSDATWIAEWVLFRAAESLTEARETAPADQFYEQTVTQTKNVGAPIGAFLLKAWADRLIKRNAWDKARNLYERALAMIGEDNTHDLFSASIWNGLGIIAYIRGDYPSSEKYHLRALAIRKEAAPGSLAVAASLQNLGAVAIDKGDLDLAQTYDADSLEIKQKLAPNSVEVAAGLNNLGKVFLLRGDLSDAESNFRQSLAIRQKLAPESAEISVNFNSLGAVAKERGNLALAEMYYTRALTIQEKLIPNSIQAAATLSNLGTVAFARNDLDLAERYFLRAIEIRKEFGPESIEVAGLFANLAAVASERGDLERSRVLHRKALMIEEKLDPDSLEVADTLGNLGRIARSQGDPALAWKNLGKAYEIQEKQAPGSLALAATLNELGALDGDRGNLKQSEDYYHRALEIRDNLAPRSLAHAESLAALGSLMKSKREWATAAQFYDQAISALENQTTRLGGAENIRTGFRAAHSNYYRDYIEILLNQGKTEFAFEISERSRSRTLLETLNEARIDLRHGVEPSLIERERNLRSSIELKSDRRIRLLSEQHTQAQLSQIENEIEVLVRQDEEAEGFIRTSSPAFALLTQPRSLAAREIQASLLDSDTVLLEYSLGEEKSYLWLVTNHSIDCFELPSRPVIEGLARDVYDQLTAPSHRKSGETEQQRINRLAKIESAYPVSNRKLSEVVLGPVASRLTTKRILVVADGALRYIPFGALSASGKEGVAGHFTPLIVDHEIVNLPSASVLVASRRPHNRRDERPMTVAVLADPVFEKKDARVQAAVAGRSDSSRARQSLDVAPDSYSKESAMSATELTRSMSDLGLLGGGPQSLPRLLYSRQEAGAIWAALPSGSVMEALDFDASRATTEKLLSSDYRVIHFATHALVDNERPQLSGLVLSMVDKHGNPQNGFLNLQDIYNLDLSADLVVLSACETGLGKDYGGEGLVGLTRGFMYAGAKRVVASLWSVSDMATAELMRRFYQGMSQEGLRPSEALRQAQIQMWKQQRWKSPYYWAAFQIHGDWN